MWSEGILDRLPLDAVRDVPGVWVVGGAVRDALLGAQPRDLDLVVEGDVGPLLERLGAPGAMHERFGTYDYDGINVAAARRETYAAPGALPDVELGATIAEDLSRRDFTINAMAVRVADGRAGAVPGALEDLRARRLRVLHERSFTDDPTRVLRMARYEARLWFEVEPRTAELARAADFATVTGARIGSEVRLALDEPLPFALAGLETWARDAIDPDFHVLRSDELSPLAALGAALLSVADPRAVLDRLGFPAQERDVVVRAARGRELAERLRAARTPAELAAVARREPAEALEVARALGAGGAVQRWLAVRDLRADVDGNDLVAAGLSGPAIGIALEAAWAAAVDGADRDAQLAAALEAAR